MNRLKRLLPTDFVDGIAFGMWVATPLYVAALLHYRLPQMAFAVFCAWVLATYIRLQG